MPPRIYHPKNLARSIALVICLSVTSLVSYSQTTLSAGDIAFTGYITTDDNVNGATQNDEFSFVLLRDIIAGTTINFTDFGWNDLNAFQTANPCGANTGAIADGIIQWQSTSAMACGTEIRILCKFSPSANIGTVTATQATSSNPLAYISLANGGDQVFAYQGTHASPSFVAGISINRTWDATLTNCFFSSNHSRLPAALASANVAITSAVNAKYNCSTTSGNAATLRTALNTEANWNKDNTLILPVPPAFALPVNCPITCTNPPVITTDPTSQSTCSGNSITFTVAALNATSYQWQEFNGGSWNDLSNTGVYSGVTTTTLTISDVTGLNGRQYRAIATGTYPPPATSAAATLTVLSSVGGTIAGGTTACGGPVSGTLTLSGHTGAVIRWEFSINGGSSWTNIANATTTHNFTNITTTTLYRARVQNGICAAVYSATATVTINPLPNVAVTPSVGIVCDGGSGVTLVASGADTYSWSPGTGIIGTTLSSTVIANPATTTTYTVTGTVTATGCQNVKNVTVVKNTPLVHSGVSATPAAICQSGTSNITGTVSGGTTSSIVVGESGTINRPIPDPGNLTSNIVLPALSIQAAANMRVRLTLTHTYVGDLSITLTSPCGTTYLFDRPGVPPNFGNGDNLNGTYTFDLAAATIIPETPSGTGNIAPGSYRPSNNGNPGVAHNWTGMSFPCNTSGTWTLSIADAAPGDNGSLASWQILTAGNYLHSLTGPGTITTLAPAGPNNNTGNFTVGGLAPGAYTYVLTSTDPLGCSVSSNVNVTVNDVPLVTTQPVNRTICQNGGTTFTVAANSAIPVTYQWQINQGSGFTDILNNPPFTTATTATLTLTNTPVSYNGASFRAIVFNACGSDTSDVVTLTVNPLPNISVAPNNQCAPVTLTASGNSNTYSWSPATGLSTTTGATVVASPAVNTTYTVTGTITATGCINTANVTVLGSATAAVLSGTPLSICSGGSANLSVNITGGVGPFTVVYSNGTTQATVNNYTSGANIPVSPATSTSYMLVSVTGANGCAAAGISGSVDITVIAPITIGTHPANQTACQGGNATFNVTTTSGNSLSYQWQVNTGSSFSNISGANSSSLTLTNVTTAMSTYQYRVIITNSCFNVTSNAATLTVNPSPAVTVTSLTNKICLSDTLVTLSGSPAGGVWSGIGVSNNNFIPKNTAVGNYTLTYTYTSPLGCVNSATTVARVEDCPERRILLRDNGVIIYPNPNNGRFNIRINSTLYEFLGMDVYTAAGQLVRKQIFTGLVFGRVIPIDMSNMASGTYMLKIFYDDGVRTSEKTFKVVIGR